MTSTGERIEVTTGVTTDHEGMPVAAIGIGDGPTALLNDDVRGQIALNMLQTVADAHDAWQTWRARRGDRR